MRRSLKIDPTLDLAYQVLGRGYQDAGMWDQLSATADALLRINPANHFGYFYRALVLMRAGNPPANEVEALLRKSIALGEFRPRAALRIIEAAAAGRKNRRIDPGSSKHWSRRVPNSVRRTIGSINSIKTEAISRTARKLSKLTSSFARNAACRSGS